MEYQKSAVTINHFSEQKIHAIWLGKNLPPFAQVCLDDWRKQGYHYKLWSDNDPKIQAWINTCLFAKKCYEKGLFAFVTDYLRLKILAEDGGLYLDTDVTINNNPFPLFQDVDFCVGYEDGNRLGTAIIYARKKSKILTSLITFYEERIMDSPLYMGPEIMTKFTTEQNTNVSDRIFLAPQHFFYSYQGEPMEFSPPEERYTTHWFQHSWKHSAGLVFLKAKNKGIAGCLYEWQKEFFRLR
jgi:mannosyltransferase OCH1-like enzyme